MKQLRPVHDRGNEKQITPCRSKHLIKQPSTGSTHTYAVTLHKPLMLSCLLNVQISSKVLINNVFFPAREQVNVISMMKCSNDDKSYLLFLLYNTIIH